MRNIGKYRLEREIGRGGFGQVYRAFDPVMGRLVAIKILLSQKDNDQLARFKNEASATGKLRHKNIVTVYDYGEYENKPYLVMEYLEGEDLQMIQASSRSLSLLEKVSIMTQLGEGLQHAHHAGIVHRDIKPANIMILKDGTAKIMDFGIARALLEPDRLTQDGSLLGTLAYLAPEVFQGTDVDHLCDIFSAGVIFYELLTSQHPFAADTPGRVIYNITTTNPPTVHTWISESPSELDQLIARAIHKDRGFRYQSMDDLLLDLAPIRLQLEAAEAQALIQKAEKLLASAQIQNAQEVLRQALLLDPNNKSGRDLREKIHREANRQLNRGQYDQPLASEEKPHEERAVNSAKQKAESFVAVQNFAAALAEIDRVLQITESAELVSLRQRIFSDAQTHWRASLAQSAISIKDRIQRREYQMAVDVGKEALDKFPNNTIIVSLLSVAEMALAEEERAFQISRSCADAESLASRQDYDGALRLVRDSLLELGEDSALEALAQRFEKELQQYTQQKAIEGRIPENTVVLFQPESARVAGEYNFETARMAAAGQDTGGPVTRKRRLLPLAAAILLLAGVAAGAISAAKSYLDFSADRTATTPSENVPNEGEAADAVSQPAVTPGGYGVDVVVAGGPSQPTRNSGSAELPSPRPGRVPVPTGKEGLEVLPVSPDRAQTPPQPQELAIDPISESSLAPSEPSDPARAWAALQHSTNMLEWKQFVQDFPNSPQADLVELLIKRNEERLAAEKSAADKIAAAKAAADKAAADTLAQRRAEIDAIKNVLVRHAAAYAREDLNTLASTWPMANLGEHFRNVTVESYELQPLTDPVFRNDQEATIDVLLASREVSKSGRREAQNTEGRVVLRKEKGIWTIQSLQPR